jgi:nucleoid-associated protein YgaU
MLGNPSLGYPALSRSPVHRDVPPVPPHVVGTQVAHAGKAIPRGEITSSEKPAGYRSVRVQPGDTLWKLAFKYLGQGKDWLVLLAHNPQVTDLQRLQVGTWLRLPDEAPVLKPPERVRIKLGDSLWKLTQARFGNGAAWSCVAQANPQLYNVQLIFPGQILKIPESCAATPLSKVRFPEVSSGSSPSSSAQLLRLAH